MLQSPDIEQNSEGSISNFQTSGQSLIKVNCHNSRASDDVEMIFRPVTKLDKRNKATLRKFDDDVISFNCDTINIFSIYEQFGPIHRPDSGRIVCKFTFSLTVTFHLTKTESRTKKSIT